MQRQNSSAKTGLPALREVRTNLGRTAPIGPPSSGHNSLLPPAAIPAAPGKFNAPSPTRRTSPVMTNDRVSPPSPNPRAECRHNGSAIRRPCPAGHPATLPVSMSASLPLHPDHLLHPAPNAKTRETQGLAGFGPGAFLPLTLSLMPQIKEQIKNFLKKDMGSGLLSAFFGGGTSAIYAACARAIARAQPSA